jgi:hypothetical protein
MKCLPLAPLVALLAAVPAVASDVRDIHQVYSLTEARSVRVEIPAGSIRLETVPDRKLRADLTVKCSGWSDRCVERAKRVELVGGYEDGTFVLRVEGMPKNNNHGMSLSGTVQIPRDLALNMEMGAGDLNLFGIERDAEVSLGAGDLGVHMRERAARSVNMEVGLGDATLRRPGEHVSGHGFISKSLYWRGTGPADVHLHLGVGDINATLDE